MPMPTANKGESHDDFIDRCHSALHGEFERQDQRHAVCESQWRKKPKGSRSAKRARYAKARGK